MIYCKNNYTNSYKLHISIFLGNCNFDTGMCTWKNDQTHDNFDWLITSQSTGSFNTGPVQDHTMNNATGIY